MPTPSFTDIIKAYLEAQFGGDVPPIPGITIDSELSDTSENPVQNKVINAALQSKGTYSKPSGGIPKSDLASGVQTSLSKADTAVQPSAIDSELSGTSENPVQNKVITAALALKAALTDIPEMATQANMSDWTSGKTVDAAVLAHDFGLVLDHLDDVTEGLSETSDKVTELDDEMSVIRDYPLVKEYTADSAQTGIFSLTFDKPLKALRVLIEGVANSDVSARQYATLQIGTGSTSFYLPAKILYGKIVSNTAFTAFIDVRLDKAMKKWISDGAIGPVSATNGFLDARQLNIINAAVNEGRTNIFNLRIQNDQTNGVAVTTGTTIKVYGLEVS